MNFATLGKNSTVVSEGPSGAPPGVRAGEYTELIQRIFGTCSVVAIIGAGSGVVVTDVCKGVASELSRLGRSVVLVSVQALLQPVPIALPDETAYIGGHAPNVCVWPSSTGREFK